MSTIDLNQVATFVKVVESGSFTAAATALGLPKSSVSRAVGRLEDSLGVRLLQRTTRKLHLTEAGRGYFQQARAALGGLQDANTAVADLGQEPRGTVRITTPADSGDGVFATLIARFVALHPRIRVEVSLTGRRVDLVAEGFDLAVRAGPLDDSSLVARRVAATDLRLYAAPSYLERRGRPRRLVDLVAHDCLVLRTSQGLFPWRLTGPRGVESVEVSGPVVADEMIFVQRLALNGLGIALIPEMGARPDVESGRLARVLPAYTMKGGVLSVVSPPLRHAPAAVILLRDYLLAELPKHFTSPR
jgi:DNA-binding transcriptional LysR family regulator